MLDFLYKQDIENTVLSTFMMDNDEFYNTEHYPELFTQDNIHVYIAIKELLLSSAPADIVTVTDRLRGVVSAKHIIDIADSPVSAVDLKYHVSALETARYGRDLYHAYTYGAEKIKHGSNPLEIESEVKSKISTNDIQTSVEAKDLSIATIENLDSGGVDGLRTGFRTLDRVTNGFYPKEFIVVAGRPGMGKTSFLLSMAKYFGKFYEPGIIFSLEMSNEELVKRMYCDLGSVNNAYLFRNKLTPDNKQVWSRINKAAESVADMPIWFDDQASLTIDMIYSRARKAKMTKNIKWIAIDHLGLVSGWNQKGQEPKAEITRMCKAMAKDLGCTVIVLSQMNREIEKGKPRAPVMSDLRDAGSIEQDADMVLFPTVPNKNPQGTNGAEYDTAEVYIAKTRRGWACMIDDMKFQGHYYRYANIDI